MTIREVVFDLIASTSDEEVEDGFSRLNSILEQEHAAAEKREEERRKAAGVTMLARAGAAEAAVEEWNAEILAARAARETEPVEDDAVGSEP